MCSPIISPLIGLWTSASMEEKSSPGKWAQPGVRHPPAPAQSASTEYPCPTLCSTYLMHLHHSSAPHCRCPQKPPPCGDTGQEELRATSLEPNSSPASMQGRGRTLHSQPQSQEVSRKLPVCRQLQLLPPALGTAGLVAQGEGTARTTFPLPAEPFHAEVEAQTQLCHPVR